MMWVPNIDELEALDLIQGLIQHESINPPGNVDGCAQYIFNWLIKCGIETSIIKVDHVSNVLARIGNKNGKRLLWNGHFDTVPIGNIDYWDADPFSGLYQAGNVYGRGSCDMKGGIAAFMLALKALKDQMPNLPGELVLMFAGDEETGSERGTLHYLNTLKQSFSAAVVSEPTDLRIEFGQRGLRWIQITVSGKACHAGRPYAGNNAVEYAAKVISALKDIKFENRFDNFEVPLPSLTITMIDGGVKENVITDTCVITVDRRMMPGETEEHILTEINSKIASIHEDGFSVEVKIMNRGWDPYIISTKEEIFTVTGKAYQEITQQYPVSIGKGACTDASHIHHYGIPTIIFGPGDPKNSHTANEHVPLDSIVLCAKICALAARNFLKEGEKNE